jgi:hypothetical protein
MILFTKECFLQIKSITNIYINVLNADNDTEFPLPGVQPQWQVIVQGLTELMSGGLNDFQQYINCNSKKDAYRMYNDLIKQVIDSGEIPTMNNKLLDDVLTK